MLVLRNEDTLDEVATLGESFRPALGVAGEEVADDKASPEELLFLPLTYIHRHQRMFSVHFNTSKGIHCSEGKTIDNLLEDIVSFVPSNHSCVSV